MTGTSDPQIQVSTDQCESEALLLGAGFEPGHWHSTVGGVDTSIQVGHLTN